MSTSQAETVLGHLYQTAGAAALAGTSDTDLLRRFTAGGGPAEAAFAALLHRHGPSVLRVCRSTSRTAHDAEDAFQATFLVLAVKARSLALRGPLALWLYGVARRIALQARAAADRRRRYEQRVAKAEAGVPTPAEPDVAGAVLDAVGGLPERFRSAVILCDLEGLSYAEAAERLGWTHATLRNRLARGRDRLRVSLERKGLAPVTALAAGGVPPVPRALAAATARAAVGVASGAADEWVPASVVALMNGGLRAMLFTQVKTVGLSVLAAAGILVGAHGLTARGPVERAAAEVSDPGVGFQQPATADATPANQPASHPRTTAEMIAAKLNQPFSINQEIPGVPLKEVLDVLSDKYGLTFIVDVQSFETATGNRNVEETNVRLPKMPGVTLHAVLRHLLAQVQGTFIVRGDHLEVAHLDQARLEAYGNTPRPVGQRSAQPLVNVACEQRPLDAVLTDVARQAGRNVVLDARVTGREKLVVTAVLLNAPTDTAVRVLAELANLKSVQLDNVFFVTTRELAAELQAEQDKRAETQSREPAGKTPPPAVPKGSGPPMP